MRGTLNQHCFFNERDLEAGSHFGVIDSVELFQQLLKKFKLFQQLLKRFQQLLTAFFQEKGGGIIQTQNCEYKGYDDQIECARNST